MNSSWSDFKSLAISKGINIQYTTYAGHYYLEAHDGPFSTNCIIAITSPANDDQSDFETNFKPTANQPVISKQSVQQIAPFGSKTLVINGVTKNLFSRFTGIQQPLVIGPNVISFVMTYPWAKIIGVEVIGGENLDTADLKVLDTPTGTYSGIPNLVLNQFAYSINIGKDFYQKMAQYDADIHQNMVVQIVYNSVSIKTIGINFLINEVK